MIIRKYHLVLVFTNILMTSIQAMEDNPLIDAIKIYCEKPDKNTLATIQQLITQKELVNKATERDNISPLHHAALYKLNDVVKLLIEAQAVINVHDARENTVLHYAALWNCIPIMQQLLAAGALVNAVNKNHDTPLHYAASCSSPAGIELLVTAGASINARNTAGKTPLHEATMLFDTIRLAVLIKNGADPSIANNEGIRPIQHAVEKKNYRAVALLLSAGSPLPHVHEMLSDMYPSNSPLPAIILGHNTVLDQSKLYESDNFGILPLVYAAAQGHKNIVKQLLFVHHVDPWITTKYQNAAPDIVTMILKRTFLTPEQKKSYEQILVLCYAHMSTAYSLQQESVGNNYLAWLPESIMDIIMCYVAHRSIKRSCLPGNILPLSKG